MSASRRRVAVALVVAVLLAAVVLIAWSASRGGDDGSAARPSASPSAGEPEAVPETPEPEAAATGIAALPDPAWVSRVAAAAGVPERALAAYAGATLRLASDDPGCGLDWATLAGIGAVESEHGTVHGGRIDELGVQAPPVYGIPLDGSRTDRIADTDGGALDGDPVWDRAVGPMQFIPSIWQRFRADGNGDGAFDPQNLDDAALTAGVYLCEAGGDLREPSNWIAAVAAYNNTVDYNNRVASVATRYASAAGG